MWGFLLPREFQIFSRKEVKFIASLTLPCLFGWVPCSLKCKPHIFLFANNVLFLTAATSKLPGKKFMKFCCYHLLLVKGKLRLRPYLISLWLIIYCLICWIYSIVIPNVKNDLIRLLFKKEYRIISHPCILALGKEVTVSKGYRTLSPYPFVTTFLFQKIC